MTKEVKLIVHNIATENTLNYISSVQTIHAVSSKVPVLATMNLDILRQKFNAVLVIKANGSCEMCPVLKLVFDDSNKFG